MKRIPLGEINLHQETMSETVNSERLTAMNSEGSNSVTHISHLAVSSFLDVASDESLHSPLRDIQELACTPARIKNSNAISKYKDTAESAKKTETKEGFHKVKRQFSWFKMRNRLWKEKLRGESTKKLNMNYTIMVEKQFSILLSN